MKNKQNKIILYKDNDKKIRLDVKLQGETVWLSLNQIAYLYNTHKSGISRHIKNIYQSGELSKKSTVAKIATVQKEGKRKIQRTIEYYDLDAIISVGYRVNSKKATEFRIWATKILKDHIIQGYTLNNKRLIQTQEKFEELRTAIAFLKDKTEHTLVEGQEKEILGLLANYAKTLSLLEQYDKNKLIAIKNGKSKYILHYEEAQKIIDSLKSNLLIKDEAEDLFGKEYDDKLKSIIANIYQTFGKKELYSSLEEKAAHLLYFIIKDHPFVDGNKRIGSFLFIYFLDKNHYLYKNNGEKKINDNALVTLALLIAISNPGEKDKLIKIITHLLNER